MSKLKTFAAISLFALSLPALAGEFVLTSPTIKANGRLGSEQVLNGFGCKGKNVSPALEWRGAPVGTKSYAVTVYDPDAPTGSGWWHWVVVNLPADVKAMPAGAGSGDGKSLPEGAAQVRTDYGQPGFGGACPPAGDKPHRYIFTVHALKTEKIELPPDATAAMAGFMINANRIGKASFTARYSR